MGFTRGTGRRLAVTRWASLEKQELLILNLPAVCCGVHVAQSLFFCVVFCEPLFSLFFFISFGRYIVCPYGRYIVCPYGRFTSSHYPLAVILSVLTADLPLLSTLLAVILSVLTADLPLLITLLAVILSVLTADLPLLITLLAVILSVLTADLPLLIILLVSSIFSRSPTKMIEN
jgi:hypothetical protein